jgi:hypothetical protein
VDLVFYGQGNRLEYDFVLRPGADANAIRMRFTGAGQVSVTADGDLAMETPAGRILQKKPLIYQQDERSAALRTVSGRYILRADGAVGMQLEAYDHAQTLVIDPVIEYTTLLGGSGTETLAGFKLRNGMLYVAGSTQTGDWVLQSTDIPYNNLTDSFVMIIDITKPVYVVKYFTYLGGSGVDTALAMDVDLPGFVYLVGTTNSGDYPMGGTPFQTTGPSTPTPTSTANTTISFISKLDPNQAGNGTSLVYSSYIGGTLANDSANSIAVAANGIAYVFGTAHSADFPVTANAYASSLYGISDCFLAQIDTNNGPLLYATFIGGELDDDGRAIALGPNGLIYFAANTAGAQFPLAGQAYNGFSAGDYDVVVGAFDLTQPANVLVYATYLGGSLDDEVRGMALDSKGRMLITGYTLSPDFPVTALTAVQPHYNGNSDAFVALVDLTQPPYGFLVYSSFLGGTDGDVGYGAVVDSLGYLYVSGYTLSGDFPVTANVPQQLWGGGVDMFVARINPAVAGRAGLDYSTYIGVDSTIVGTNLMMWPDGSLLVGGYTEGYLPLLGTYTPIQGNYGGGFSDDFLLLLSPGAGLNGSGSPAALPETRKGRLTEGVTPRDPRR